MLTREEVHDVLSAVLEAEPTTFPEPQQFDLARAILADNFVGLRAMDAMVKHFAAQAIRDMQPLERQRLRTKLRIAQPAAVQPSTTWAVGLTQGGMLHIRASVPGEFMVFAGAPKGLAKHKFRNEPMPQSVLEEYASRYENMFFVDVAGYAYDHDTTSSGR